MRRMYSENQLENKVKSVQKDISTLVDKDGHDRFIEGDINIETIEGVTKKYGKWSLSGTHLLIVLCIDVADTTVLTNGLKLANLNLPDFIKDKIVPVFLKYVSTSTYQFWSDGGNLTTVGVYMIKDNNALSLTMGQNYTASNDRHARIQIDLLIDSD